MTLLSSTIPNFVNGISQQPYTLRLTSQGEVQENGLSTVSSGLRKRPATEHLAKVSNTPVSDAFLHLIDRDGSEQYQVIITDGDLKVYDLAGNAKTVNFTNQAYLDTASSASSSFAVTTVADYSFIVNKTKVTAVGSALSAVRPYEALFNVKLGNYGKTYSVLVNGSIVFSHTTPNGGVATDAPNISTDFIATALYNGLVAAGYNTGAWVCSVQGSSVYLKNTTTDFTVSSADGFSNTAMVAIKGKLQKFTDLPVNPRIDSFVVQITGDQSSAFDNYYVKFDAGGTNNTVGVWKETIAPGIRTGLDATTMPHKLVREIDGTFTFEPATWDSRATGDLTSNPDPSFIGTTINDIFFFQNRLGFLADENFIQTETGKYFNVYRTTVVSLLDSDPVDVTAATNKVSILKHAVSFNKQLLLFSNQQQFMVDSAELMSPKHVPIKPTTDFYVNTLARPVAAGKNVYFTTDKGNWSSVREYFVDLSNLTNDAIDISSHVPVYIPSGVTKIAAGVSEDILVLLSSEDPTKLYVYKYYFSGSEKLQSSWSSFTFGTGGTILGCEFIRSTLYLVISRAEGIFFEKMDFSIGANVTGEPYPVRLDRKVQLETTALTFDGTYTVVNAATLGYLPNDGAYMAVSQGGGTIKAGQLYDVIYSAGVTKILGNLTASKITLGKKYTFRYQVSPLTIKIGPAGSSRVADTEGRTQVRKISFNHADTGYYKVLVTPEARQTYTYIFSGKVTGTPSAVLGTESLSTGRLTVPVVSRNNTVSIVIESDMPTPVSIFSADWEAHYVKRSRAV
jgi:hypothetical protein